MNEISIRQRSKITLIHTADAHLGRAFHDLGPTGRHLRRAVEKAFARVVDAALSRKADLFLVAGDLFDSARPPRASLALVDSCLTRLAKAGVRTIIIPGTHDPSGSSPFSSPTFSSRGGRVFVLTPRNPAVYIEELALAAAAWMPGAGGKDAWIGPPTGWDRDARFRVGLAHGSNVDWIEGGEPEDLLPAELLKGAGLDYLALGHHHGAGPIEGSDGAAWYSGSPEILASDQTGAGHALFVTLEATGTGVERTVEKIEVGRLSTRKIEVDISAASDQNLEAEIAALAHEDLYLDVVLRGILPADADPADVRGVMERRAQDFFRLRILDKLERTPAAASVEDFPSQSVAAEFIKRTREKIEAAELEERGEWEEALRLGLAFLTGGES